MIEHLPGSEYFRWKMPHEINTCSDTPETDNCFSASIYDGHQEDERYYDA